jgi:hypothetical protein
VQIDLERFGEAMLEETPPVIIGARRRDRKDTRFDLDPRRDGEGVALGTGQLWKLTGRSLSFSEIARRKG